MVRKRKMEDQSVGVALNRRSELFKVASLHALCPFRLQKIFMFLFFQDMTRGNIFQLSLNAFFFILLLLPRHGFSLFCHD